MKKHLKRLIRIASTGFLAVFFLSSCAGLSFFDSTRTLTLQQETRGLKVTQTYFHDGHYDDEAIIALSRTFRDVKNGDIYPVDPALLDYLYAVRRSLGVSESTPIQIINGYRDPSRNREMAKANKYVAKESLHTAGKAADIRIPGVSGQRILSVALNLKQGGAAFYPSTGHVHLDTGSVRTWAVK